MLQNCWLFKLNSRKTSTFTETQHFYVKSDQDLKVQNVCRPSLLSGLWQQKWAAQQLSCVRPLEVNDVRRRNEVSWRSAAGRHDPESFYGTPLETRRLWKRLFSQMGRRDETEITGNRWRKSRYPISSSASGAPGAAGRSHLFLF